MMKDLIFSLISIADRLDVTGYTRQADMLDRAINKLANNSRFKQITNRLSTELAQRGPLTLISTLKSDEEYCRSDIEMLARACASSDPSNKVFLQIADTLENFDSFCKSQKINRNKSDDLKTEDQLIALNRKLMGILIELGDAVRSK